MNIRSIRSQFPIFSNNKNLVYLDNAATTQKPKRVINKINEYYSKFNSNVHRGLYPLSDKSTEMYEDARRNIAKFINAESEEIIFTSGATEGINAIAMMLYQSGLIDKKPRILLSELEHHSNILPWQRTNPREIDYQMITSDNILTGVKLENKFDILSLTHVSNVTGSILPIDEILKNNQGNYKYSIVDASQSIAHLKIDVKKLDVDFLVFSGHKAYGPTGVGVLYAKKEILEELEPYKVGGGMIKEVNRNDANWSSIPEKFEAGTPPISEAIALSEAIDFIREYTFEKISKEEKILREYLYTRLSEINNIKIFHPPLKEDAVGVISFFIDGVHPHDIAQFLGDRNICVRAGHHCTQILHREVFNIPASVRASLAIYNTKKDIDKLIDGIKSAIEYFS